jgi:hypothetical protein
VLALAASALVLPTAGKADDQPVSGTTLNVLGLAVSAPVVLTNFAPGQTATGTGVVTVVSTGPWVLRTHDGGASATAGRMLRTTGSGGAAALAQALHWSAAPTLGGTGASGNLTGSSVVASSGTLSDVVNVSFSQPIGASEQLVSGNVYQVTVTWTVSAT